MNILHVTSGISLSSGGPTRSVKGLCRALATSGVTVSLLVLRGEDVFENPCGVRVIRGVLNCPALLCFDVVHLHGLWNWQLHKIMKSCQESHVPYIVSPRGMLDPWALSVKKWKKRLGMLLYQRSDLKHAAAFHATAELEASNIRAQGLKQPIIVAPNGVDVPQDLPEVKARGGRRTAIFLSRLHPGKGLLTLAEAWARVKPQGWVMRVVGPDSYGHKAEVLEKLDALGITHADAPACTQSNNRTIEHSNNSSWQFVDMVDDKAKWQEYAAAEILIHPSVSENFGITIAEGLAAGLPVICTDGTPWTDVRDHACGWFIKANSIESLADALRSAMTKSNEALLEMGEKGAELVRTKYAWEAVVKPLIRGYEALI